MHSHIESEMTIWFPVLPAQILLVWCRTLIFCKQRLGSPVEGETCLINQRRCLSFS